MHKDRRKWRPYLAVLGIALVASALLLYFWRREKNTALEELTVTAQAAVRELAGRVPALLRPHIERGRIFAQTITAADAENMSAEEMLELPRALFDDPAVRSAWFILEADESLNLDRMEVRYWRNDGEAMYEVGEDPEKPVTESEEYLTFREEAKLRLMPGRRVEITGFSWMAGISAESFPTLAVEAPVMRGGKFAGGVGVEADIPEITDGVRYAGSSLEGRIFLLRPDGFVVADSSEVDSGNNYTDIFGYADALGLCLEAAEKAGKTEKIAPVYLKLYRNDDAVAICETLNVDDEVPLLLASLWPTERIYKAAGVWLFSVGAVLILAAVSLFVIGILRQGQRAKSDPAAATLSPAQQEAFRRTDRKREFFFFMSALFFIPALFFLRGAEKRYQEAKRVGDVESAQKAVDGMTPVVAICVVIGGILVYLNWISR